MPSHRRNDVRGVAGGCDDAITGRERRLCDIDAHTAARAGDEPNLGTSHSLPPVILMPAQRRPTHDGHYAEPVGGGILW